jgi:hypothetical protein
MKILHANPRVLVLLYFPFLMPVLSNAQVPGESLPFAADLRFAESDELDKCGFDPEQAAALRKTLGDHWGYGYDDLLTDLQIWQNNPYVTIDSIGASVQNRALWELTITADSAPINPRRTVYIHARTHPGEVQSWWVTKEIITILLAEDDFARSVRDSCVFYIIPMYNPDGVELEYPRENANGIDIESNWNKSSVQPEVAALRSRFQTLMTSRAPIEIALNMHSAYGTNRYFVYHDAAGTSASYAVLQRQFIEGTRAWFPGGIRPWSHYISWKTGTATQYPESWFWLNYRESVMALTYEDMNDPSAGAFDRTANAIVHGIIDYLGRSRTQVVASAPPVPAAFILEQNYPNPFNTATTIPYQLALDGPVSVRLYDLLGREVALLFEGNQTAGRHSLRWDATGWPSGVYYISLQAGMYRGVKQAVIVR